MTELGPQPLATEPRPPQEISAEVLLREAEHGLAGGDPSPFSPQAYEVLKRHIAQYIADVLRESVKLSRRYRSDNVSAAHVDRASEYLVSSQGKRFFRHLGTIGGILLGGALSNILAMTQAGRYTTTGNLLSISLGIVGTFLVALHIARE